jgi:hypothetical protein
MTQHGDLRIEVTSVCAPREDEMDEKILTKHPDPDKQGVRISKAKYDLIRETILDLLRANSELTFTELTSAANERLDGKFDGSVSWYVTTVKLDLEARKVIERVPKSKPQRLRTVTG